MLALALVVACLVVTGAFVALAYARGWSWTGFAGQGAGGTRKTLWDWLQLLVIPLAVAGVAFALNTWQSDRDQRREDRRQRETRMRAADDRREDVLRTYLQDMSGFMLRGGLLHSPGRSAVRSVARTVTLTALRRLDPDRKSIVVRFLAEARLIRGPVPKVSLSGADLRGIALPDVTLDRPDFTESRLDGADFRNAVLIAATFSRAALRRSDFRGAQFPQSYAAVAAGVPIGPDVRTWDIPPLAYSFTGALFDGAVLTGARFDKTDLPGADFSGAQLLSASFVGAELQESVFEDASLRDADFTRAYLRRGAFSGACVSHARFVRANLAAADFNAIGRDVDLSHANLHGVADKHTRGLVDVSLRGAWRDTHTALRVARDVPSAIANAEAAAASVTDDARRCLQ